MATRIWTATEIQHPTIAVYIVPTIRTIHLLQSQRDRTRTQNIIPPEMVTRIAEAQVTALAATQCEVGIALKNKPVTDALRTE